MLHGHGGVTIGSEMSGGVHNVTVADCVFQAPTRIRIKSQRGRGGVVEGLAVANIVMQDVPHPFVITTFYWARTSRGLVLQWTKARRASAIFFSATSRRGGRPDAGSITGLRELPIENITFSNVHVEAARGFDCTNAKGISFLTR